MAAYFQSWILLISVASGMYCVGESSDTPFMTFPPVGTLCPSVVPLKHATVQIISNRAASTRRQRELDNITRPAAPPQNVLRTRPKRKARKDSPPTNDLQDTLTVGISMEYVILYSFICDITHHTHTQERERERARARAASSRPRVKHHLPPSDLCLSTRDRHGPGRALSEDIERQSQVSRARGYA
jgi:hypothetical protein